VVPLSPHRLWAALSLRALNGHLAGRLAPEEAAFNASAPASRDPTSLAAFPFEFPPAPLGSPPCLLLLQLRNTSPLPVHLSIALPTEAPVPAEPWALDMDEPRADELADHELCDDREDLVRVPRASLIRCAAHVLATRSWRSRARCRQGPRPLLLQMTSQTRWTRSWLA
jgi:hypothetical protein